MSSPSSSGHSARTSLGRNDGNEAPRSILQRDAPLEGLDVGLTREDEQIANLFEGNLPAGPTAEVPKRDETALGDVDVQHIRELGADAAGGAAR